MKTPFRLQVSNYDCVPTTFLNAVSYLFSRNEIPPLVLQKIYLYSLDTVTTSQNLGHGTTGFAIQLLGNWLSTYKNNRFSLSSEYVDGKGVHLRKGNKISRCLNNNGVALLRVHTTRSEWHYILLLYMKSSWLYCFDPYPHSKRYNTHDNVEFIDHDNKQSPNLRIRAEHIDTLSNSKKYVFGSITERECLLLCRN